MTDWLRNNLDYDPVFLKKWENLFIQALDKRKDIVSVDFGKEQKKEEKELSTKITLENKVGKVFNDLAVGEHFVIDTEHSKGAVYRKVEVEHAVLTNSYGGTNKLAMMEVATAKTFLPTQSYVKVVDVEIKVKAVKPSLPGY